MAAHAIWARAIVLPVILASSVSEIRARFLHVDMVSASSSVELRFVNAQKDTTVTSAKFLRVMISIARIMESAF